jgi:hypothetical protein
MAVISWLSEIPDDYRVRFGFGSWEYPGKFSGIYAVGDFTRLNSDVTEVPTTEFLKAIEEFKEDVPDDGSLWAEIFKPNWWFYTNIFVRDNDCKGHNRLYQFRVVKEYNDDTSAVIRNQGSLIAREADVDEDDGMMMAVPDAVICRKSGTESCTTTWNRIMYVLA